MENPRLDGGADGDALVGVEFLVGFLAEKFAHSAAQQGHPRLAADQDDVFDGLGLEIDLAQGFLDERESLVHKVPGQFLQEGPRERLAQVPRTCLAGGDEGQVDLGLVGEGQFPFGLLGRLLDALEGVLVPGQVVTRLPAVLLEEPLDDALVEVLAAQIGIAVGREDMEDAAADLQDGDVEGPAAHVKNGHRSGRFGVQAVSQAGRRRLIDDAQDVQAGDGGRILGRLALVVVEIGRNGDDGFLDVLAEMG